MRDIVGSAGDGHHSQDAMTGMTAGNGEKTLWQGQHGDERAVEQDCTVSPLSTTTSIPGAPPLLNQSPGAITTEESSIRRGGHGHPASVRHKQMTPAEQSREVWLSQAAHPAENGCGVGEGGRGTGKDASIEVAMTELRLDDSTSTGDEEGEIEGDVDSQDGQSQHQDGKDGDLDCERNAPPKFGLKMLIPAAIAGCLIGKGGRIISQLQNSTGTRVKLSQKNEFFPGTHDRVVLIRGDPPEMVADAAGEMLRRLGDAGRQHPHAPQPPPNMMPHVPGQTGFEGGGDGVHGRLAPVTVRLLVPLAVGGLIIGKGGETVKAIGAKTGAKVTLAGKDADVAGMPSERLCTIQGDLEGVIKVVAMIVGKMAEDRGLSKYQSNQTCYHTGFKGSPLPGSLVGVLVPTNGGSANNSMLSGAAVAAVAGANAQQAGQQHQRQHLGGGSSLNPQQQQRLWNVRPPPPAGVPTGVRPLSAGESAPFGISGMVPGIVPGPVPGQPDGGAGSSGWLGMGMGGGQGQGIGVGMMRGRLNGGPASAWHVPGNVNGWGGVSEPAGGPSNSHHGQGQAAASGGVAAGAAAGGAGGGGGGEAIASAMGIATPQQQQQAMLVAGGRMYGYCPYPMSSILSQRSGDAAYAAGGVGGMQSMYPYGGEMQFLPAPVAHQGQVQDGFFMDGAGDVLAQTQLQVPDHMVGVILGKAGSTVIEMQNMTGARIQVSQRGEYIPWTHNRAVTISGTQQAVTHAQIMVHNVCTKAAQFEFRQAQAQGMHPQQPPLY